MMGEIGHDGDVVVRDRALARARIDSSPGVPWHLEELEFSRALEEIWVIISSVDAYLTNTRPWDKYEQGKDYDLVGLKHVLYMAAEALRFAAVLAHPILPQATEKLWRQLGQEGSPANQRIDELTWGQLKPSTKIGKVESLFPRIEKAEAIGRMEGVENEPQNPVIAPTKA